MTVQTASSIGPARIDIAYEVLGDATAPPVLLIMGLGAQMLGWQDDFCAALVAHRIMEILVEKKVLPEGALSLVVGSAGDILDHLGPQDVVAFTGSGDTGITIRSMPNVIRHSIRVNVEADSLNAAILGPDAEPGSDTYDFFLKDVARDMTQKAGQKCTAIRRVLAPPSTVAQVRDDLVERLRAIVVGNPAQ